MKLHMIQDRDFLVVQDLDSGSPSLTLQIIVNGAEHRLFSQSIDRIITSFNIAEDRCEEISELFGEVVSARNDAAWLRDELHATEDTLEQIKTALSAMLIATTKRQRRREAKAPTPSLSFARWLAQQSMAATTKQDEFQTVDP